MPNITYFDLRCRDDCPIVKLCPHKREEAIEGLIPAAARPPNAGRRIAAGLDSLH